ncbi:hypothetical protein RIU14_10575 [Riemerella anatipestifer]|nr:hypothetical protein [Riemerella anatipestifer]
MRYFSVISFLIFLNFLVFLSVAGFLELSETYTNTVILEEDKEEEVYF